MDNSRKPSDSDRIPARSSSREVEAFLRQVALSPRADLPQGGRGRLVFAMDATASRRPTWDEAQDIQAEMFRATAGLGGLDIQLVFFRGQGECRASSWVSDTRRLLGLMRQVECVGGYTQIERVLRHTLAEAREGKINALVYVGDCMEEDPDEIARRAGELGLLGVPIFAFQEGEEPQAQACFRDMARLTRGAYCAFDRSSAAMLRDLLSAVAVYAAGGIRALEDYARRSGGSAQLLIGQMR